VSCVLTILSGTQSFSKKIAASLPSGAVHLNSPVISIDDNGILVTVITSRRTFKAKHVILSIPTVLYKTILLQPPLPPTKDKLINSTVHGHLSKVFLAYDSPWWRDAGCCGLTQSLIGLVAVTRDTSNDKAGKYSLLGFIAGDAGRAWSKLPSAERRQAVVKHFHSVFTGIVDSVPAPIDYIEQMWWNEPFSQGCPCPAMPLGLMTEVGGDVTAKLRERHGNLHFVGTEMAEVWKGYMEGAVRSGERGAREVVEELEGELEAKL
jgi:monoamine oxidase